MRQVKKSLKQLDNPDPEMSEHERLEHTRRCLLKIGDHINATLAQIKDPDLVKEWKRYKWEDSTQYLTK